MVVVQSESERRMHRVLYILRFLRAGLIHESLMAILMFMGLYFNIEGIYPPVDEGIHAVEAMIAKDGRPNYLIALTVISMFARLLIFAIMYFAITNVWKKSLRAISMFLLSGMLVNVFVLGTTAIFSIRHLSPVFSGLYILSLIVTYWIFLDLAIGLWRVAGTPEVSSFRATLDTRLSRGSWGILNKILDLPRAPFRSWRVLVAYLLSLAGMVAFFAFLAYAISFGNIHNKAFPFQETCVISNMRQCVDQSESVAYDMIFWIAVSIVGIRLSLTLHARGKKLAALSVREVLTKPDEKYLLYLRPFASDDVKLPLPRLPLVSRLMAPLPFRTLAEEEFWVFRESSG